MPNVVVNDQADKVGKVRGTLPALCKALRSGRFLFSRAYDAAAAADPDSDVLPGVTISRCQAANKGI